VVHCDANSGVDVDVGGVADVSEMHDASIFMVEDYASFCVHT
jgi:hypothetical protein